MRSQNSSTRPRQRLGVRAEVLDGSTTLIAPDGGRYVLNDTALALWELCDGHTLPAEMVEAVCRLFALSPEVVTPDVEHLLDDLQRHHLIDWRGASGRGRPQSQATNDSYYARQGAR